MKNKTLLTRAAALLISSAFAVTAVSCGTDISGNQTSGSSESMQTTESANQKPAPDETVKYDVISENYTVGTTAYGSVYMECCIVIENTGTKNLYIDGTDLDIEDSSGALVDTQKNIKAYPDVIAPGERSVIYDTFSIEGDADNTYTVKASFDIKKAKVPVSRLEVSDVSIKEDQLGYIKAVGRVKNTTNEKQSLYTLAIVLYDSSDKVISVISTYPDALEPGQSTSFSVSNMANYGNVNYSDIARYEAFAFALQYQFD